MNSIQPIDEKNYRVITPDNRIYNLSLAAGGVWNAHLFSQQSTITGRRSKLESRQFNTLSEALEWAGASKA